MFWVADRTTGRPMRQRSVVNDFVLLAALLVLALVLLDILLLT